MTTTNDLRDEAARALDEAERLLQRVRALVAKLEKDLGRRASPPR
jgi:NaMN:DMB phosphoribosyltransferase